MRATTTFQVRWNTGEGTYADFAAAIRAAHGLPHGSGWVVERIGTKGQIRPIASERANEPGSWDFLDKNGAPTEIYDAGDCTWLNFGTVC